MLFRSDPALHRHPSLSPSLLPAPPPQERGRVPLRRPLARQSRSKAPCWTGTPREQLLMRHFGRRTYRRAFRRFLERRLELRTPRCHHPPPLLPPVVQAVPPLRLIPPASHPAQIYPTCRGLLAVYTRQGFFDFDFATAKSPLLIPPSDTLTTRLLSHQSKRTRHSHSKYWRETVPLPRSTAVFTAPRASPSPEKSFAILAPLEKSLVSST